MIVDRCKRMFSSLRAKWCRTPNLSDFSKLYGSGRFAEAYAAFRHMVKEEPRYLQLGDIYIMWADLELLVNLDARRALELLDTAQEKNCSQMAYYYAKRGEALAMTGQEERAIQCYRESVAVDPCAYYRSNLARILSLRGDPEARVLWEQILDEDAKSWQAHAYLAWEMAKSGDEEKARCLEQKAEGLERIAKDVLDVALLYHRRGRLAAAIELYREALELDFRDKSVLYAGIADCYVSLGNAEQARKYLQCAKSCAPDEKYVRDVWKEYERAFG